MNLNFRLSIFFLLAIFSTASFSSDFTARLCESTTNMGCVSGPPIKITESSVRGGNDYHVQCPDGNYYKDARFYVSESDVKNRFLAGYLPRRHLSEVVLEVFESSCPGGKYFKEKDAIKLKCNKSRCVCEDKRCSDF